ncbi:hypothetical protein FQZ97_599730 [compost metagenome]
MTPIRSVPAMPRDATRTCSRMALVRPRISSARNLSSSPGRVTATPRGNRVNNAAPSSASSAAICRDSAGCAICRDRAASAMLPASQTPRKYRSCFNSKARSPTPILC